MDLCLKGCKEFEWNSNLDGFIRTDDGKLLNDKQVRMVVEWGIIHNYKYLSEIPEDKIYEIIK